MPITREDRYFGIKISHMADRCDHRGRVSPLCAESPRAINLKIATWTLQADAVTCVKCLAKLGVADAIDESERRLQKVMDEITGG